MAIVDGFGFKRRQLGHMRGAIRWFSDICNATAGYHRKEKHVTAGAGEKRTSYSKKRMSYSKSNAAKVISETVNPLEQAQRQAQILRIACKEIQDE
jgi:hypothetical protein